MKKIATYAYVFIAVFILPAVIGQSVADALLKMYANFSRHWIAGTFVCLFSVGVVTWFPLLFLIEPFRSYHRIQIEIALLIGTIGGFFGPLVLGFANLGMILTLLLILTTLMTVTSMLTAFAEVSRQLDEARRYQESQQRP